MNVDPEIRKTASAGYFEKAPWDWPFTPMKQLCEAVISLTEEVNELKAQRAIEDFCGAKPTRGRALMRVVFKLGKRGWVSVGKRGLAAGGFWRWFR